jgi:hypothetical protein
MVPDDDLFPIDEGAPAEGAPAGGEAAPEPSAGLTREDVAGYTDRLEELGNTNAQLQQNQATIAQALQSVQQTLDRLGLNGNGTAEGEGVDAANFLTDPEAAMRKVADQAAEEKLREQAGPLLGQLVEQTHQSLMATEKANIAAEFGEEAWDKVFAPVINPIIDRTRHTAPSQLGNAEARSRAINSVKGDHFAVLTDMRKTAQETAASQAEEAQRKTLEFVNTNLTHPLQRTATGDALTPEMKDHLDREERETGRRPDEKAFLAAVKSGPTLSDFIATQQKGT